VLLTVLILFAVLMIDERARTLTYQSNLAGRLGFYGILTLGVGVLIVSGGIDLSIGSVVGLSAVVFGLLMNRGYPPLVAMVCVLGLGVLIGLTHGVLVTGLRLQPFLVTLCGLFIYRGLARGSTNVQQGIPESAEWLKDLLVGGLGEGGRNQLLLLLILAVFVGLFLHFTKWGRYLFAIGANEEAARYAGVATSRYKVLAYVLCSTLAALGGILLLLDAETVNPTSGGSLLELYAITGAVLGGCSLRGGEGMVPGMILGAAVLPLIRGVSSFWGIPSDIEYAVIGSALLLGTIADELLKRQRR
jgi:ribose transport system permease protein